MKQEDAVRLIAKAVHYAADQHTEHRRMGKRKEPYFNHVAEVAEILADATDGSDAVLVAAGLLHDTIEDTETTYEDLEDHFGEEIATLVLEVTDDKELAKDERKRLQVESAPDKSDRAKQLKIADKIANLRSLRYSPPGHWGEDRKEEYFLWAKSVVAGCRGVNPKLDALFDDIFEKGY